MDKVAYIYDRNLRQQCDKLPTMKYRASVVQDLLNSYDLMRNERLQVFASTPATHQQLIGYHSADYIQYIQSINDKSPHDSVDDTSEAFGLAYDCPNLGKLYDFVSAVAGSSITAAKLVNFGYKRVINWFGGWHHAQKAKAEGFCYINDIVLAINSLNSSKVLYVDLDVHHGDGVQKAFENSDKVVTLSVHKCVPGFYPGTGTVDELGIDSGLNFTINVPLLNGISDATYQRIFFPVFNRVCDNFKPNVVIVQCGADILAGDPLGGCNVTLEAMGQCIKHILNLGKPTLFLGGGGYDNALVARYWSYLTSIILGVNIDNDIPSHSQFFTLYTPTFELHIKKILGRKDLNSDKYLNNLLERIKAICDKIAEKPRTK